MKITSFNPLILTKNSEATVKLFETLGFEQRHHKTSIEASNGANVSSVRMKDANGFYVDVTQVDNLPQDMMTIRMNVSDFDEAYEFLTARGFKNVNGDQVTETGSSRATMMVSPSGFSISVAQHIK